MDSAQLESTCVQAACVPGQNASLEWIRFSGEQKYFGALLETIERSDLAHQASPPDFDRARQQLLAGCLRLSERSTPELHASMRQAMARLGRSVPYELFQISGGENAAACPFDTCALICLQGRMLTLLDEGTRLALLGHELGHCFCHASDRTRRLAPVLRAMLDNPRQLGIPEPERNSHLAALFWQSCEITADRCGLLACRDLREALKLEMILTTGLSASSLSWDTEAYLVQCQECVEALLQSEDSGGGRATHPQHVLRTWALHLFWESDLFHEKTGLGPGSRPIAEVDARILQALAIQSGLEERASRQGMSFDGDIPEEILLCALGACAIVAHADGEITAAEIDAIEGTFAGRINAWRNHFELKAAIALFEETAEAVMAMGDEALWIVFILICHVMAADGKFARSELSAILLIARALGCEDMWFRLLIRAGIIEVEVGDEARVRRELGSAPDAIKLPEHREVIDALAAFLNAAARRGGTKTTMRRLLRLMGATPGDLAVLLPTLQKALDECGLKALPRLDAYVESAGDASTHLDAPLRLEGLRPAPEEVEKLPDEPARALLLRALTRLRDDLVSGDGRSPSVRVNGENVTRRRPVLDLMRFEMLSRGRAERLLALFANGESVELLSPTEAASTPEAAALSKDLGKLARAARDQIDETGASDLCLGTAFITGKAGGYHVRAPLHLCPIELIHVDGAQAGWKLKRGGKAGKPNLAVLRLIANKRGTSLSDELIDALGEQAVEGEEALISCLEKAGFFTALADSTTGRARLERQRLMGAMSAIAHKHSSSSPPTSPTPAPSMSAVADQEIASAPATCQEGALVQTALHPLARWPAVFQSSERDCLELETCAAIGFFPQSSSDILHDYNELIDALLRPGGDLTDLLAGAAHLLPEGLRRELGVAGTSLPPAASTPGAVMPAIRLDPSQRQALEAVRTSPAMVIDGPPGTGKSQVIVGIVLDALSRGERVAVVSDKRAALDVVAQRLASAGFESCYGVVHDVDKDRRALCDRIAKRLRGQPSPMPSDAPRQQAIGEWKVIDGELAHRHALLRLAIGEGSPSIAALCEQLSALEQRLSALAEHAPLSKISGGDWPASIAALSPDLLIPCTEQLLRLRPFEDLMRADSIWRGLTAADFADASDLKAFDDFLAAFDRATPAAAHHPIESEQARGLGLAWLAVFRHARALVGNMTLEELLLPWSSVQPAIDALVQSPMTPLMLSTPWAEVAPALDNLLSSPMTALLTSSAWNDGKALLEAMQATPLTPLLQAPAWKALLPKLERLLSLEQRFFRWLFPSWWRLRRQTRAWLLDSWPQAAVAPLTRDFLHGLKRCADAAVAFQSGLPRPSAPFTDVLDGLVPEGSSHQKHRIERELEAWWQKHAELSHWIEEHWPEASRTALTPDFLAVIAAHAQVARALPSGCIPAALPSLASSSSEGALAARKALADWLRDHQALRNWLDRRCRHWPEEVPAASSREGIESIGLALAASRAAQSGRPFSMPARSTACASVIWEALASFWKQREQLSAWLARHAPNKSALTSESELRELATCARIAADFQATLPRSPRDSSMPFFGLSEVRQALERDVLRLPEWRQRVEQLELRLPKALRIASVIADALPPGSSSDAWRTSFLHGWASRSLSELEMRESDLKRLSAPTQWGSVEEAAQRLDEIDRQLSELEGARIQAALSSRGRLSVPPAPFGARRTPEQRSREALAHEAGKKSRRLPLRTLVRRFANEGLLDAVPVWLLSPETMSVLFPREPVFDLIVFDEASQSTMASGFPTLLRTKRWVIAGDDKQMPPANYFKATEKEDDAILDESDETQAARELFDAESLLTMARARVPHTRLTWHYRCQDEALIAFSNHAFYDASLATIPSPPREYLGQPTSDQGEMLPALDWVEVENPDYQGGQNMPEARRVVQLIAEELASGRRKSVGVITFNIKQRQAIFDAIEERRESDDAFRGHFDAAMAEPLDRRPFVKNLENVQGDERDVIFFSLGHAPEQRKGAKGPEWRVPARFGPLGRRGGERRLNVAISRARERCAIVASFRPGQLSIDKTKNIGPRLFKLFLQYAWDAAHADGVGAARRLDESRIMNGGENRAAQNASHIGVHPLPETIPVDVQIALAAEKLGFCVEQRIGVSDFQIPLALFKQGRRPLAVLISDGREKGTPYELMVHRPTLLKSKGWEVLQVTPVSWFRARSDFLKKLTA